MGRTQIDGDLILNKTVRREDLSDELSILGASRPYDYIATTELVTEKTHYVVMTEIIIIGDLIIEGTLGVL